MSLKTWVMIGMGVGSTIGALVPMIFGDTSFFDGWSLLSTFVGGMVGIWLGYKVGRALD